MSDYKQYAMRLDLSVDEDRRIHDIIQNERKRIIAELGESRTTTYNREAISALILRADGQRQAKPQQASVTVGDLETALDERFEILWREITGLLKDARDKNPDGLRAFASGEAGEVADDDFLNSMMDDFISTNR